MLPVGVLKQHADLLTLLTGMNRCLTLKRPNEMVHPAESDTLDPHPLCTPLQKAFCTAVAQASTANKRVQAFCLGAAAVRIVL